jgi:NADH dehydrogenase
MAAKQRAGVVCVLGGSGFVGRCLTSELIRRGYAVRIPTRNRARSRRLLVLPGVELVQADVHDERVLTRLAQGCDAVINLVGILNERGHDGSGFKHVHVDLAAKLVRACQENGVARLLQMSALKANAERGASHYLRTKGQAEQVIKDVGTDDIKFSIFRPSAIFGAEDSFTNRFAALLRYLPVLPLPRAEARFTPVFVDDVALAFANALQNSETYGRTYELGGPDIYSLREIVRFIQRQLRLRRLILPVPDPLGRFQAWVGDYLLPSKPFSLDNFRSLSVASVCGETGLLSLGVQPHSLEVVVPRYLAPPSRQRQLSRLRQTARR